MKKLVVVSVMLVVMLFSSICLAVSKGEPQFTVEQFKMKIGSTLNLTSILSGTNIDYALVESSNEDVVRITDGYLIKAVSTGLSTLSYPIIDKNGNEVTKYCYVEVTRDYSTFDIVYGTETGEITISLVIDGITTKINQARGAILKTPEFLKDGYVLDGWYQNDDFTGKVVKDQRFNKNTTLYARWLTTDEARAKLPTAVPVYEDVTDHWARNAIESVSYLGLFKGVSETRFGPEIHLTRGMAIAVLGRLEEDDMSGGYMLALDDVVSSAYYALDVAWGIHNGIIKDVVDNKFRPNDEITREEIAIYLYNYIKYKGYKYDLKISASYGDKSSFTKEGLEAADVLYGLNIMQGNNDGTFSPKASLTRAQMAQILYNFNNFKMKYKG